MKVQREWYVQQDFCEKINIGFLYTTQGHCNYSTDRTQQNIDWWSRLQRAMVIRILWYNRFTHIIKDRESWLRISVRSLFHKQHNFLEVNNLYLLKFQTCCFLVAKTWHFEKISDSRRSYQDAMFLQNNFDLSET